MKIINMLLTTKAGVLKEGKPEWKFAPSMLYLFIEICIEKSAQSIMQLSSLSQSEHIHIVIILIKKQNTVINLDTFFEPHPSISPNPLI